MTLSNDIQANQALAFDIFIVAAHTPESLNSDSGIQKKLKFVFETLQISGVPNSLYAELMKFEDKDGTESFAA